MSTPSLVPMISPDGRSGDIPADRVNEALAAGFKGAVVMTSPDGQLGYVPHDRANEAIQAGFKVGQPSAQEFADRGQNAEGGWSALGSDLKGIAKGSLPLLASPGLAYGGIKQSIADFKSIKETGKTLAQRAYDERVAAGRGKSYAFGAGLNESLGVNVKGEEQAADQGSMSGVVGHASAVPVAMALTEGTIRGAGAVVRGTNAIRTGAERVFVEGTPQQLMVRAIRPSVTNPDLEGALLDRMGQVYQKGEAIGKPVSNLKNYKDAVQAAATEADSSYKGLVNQAQGTPISMRPVAGAINRSIPVTDQIANPAIVNKTAGVAKRFNTTVPIESADAVRIDTNAKLNDFWNKAGGDKNAALSDPRVARTFAINEKVRDLVYNELERQTGVKPQPIQNAYGQLTEIGDAANKRGIVYGRQNATSLAEELGAVHGVKGFITAKLLKRYKNPDVIVRIAYERWAKENGFTPSWRQQSLSQMDFSKAGRAGAFASLAAAQAGNDEQ